MENLVYFWQRVQLRLQINTFVILQSGNRGNIVW